ncbi:phytase [Chitinimonas koreensis]|uniref:phytase n=1 Tax=Chitinimonas koreensis TaxID=356302 RepID=UPI0004087A60|nr:phytase [Chitinimonas koreensis]QNM98370.1 phytase [Chitinimonas koreensis]
MRSNLALILAALLPGGFAHAAAPDFPDAVRIAALPDGGWLVQTKQALRLTDAAGRERAALTLRSDGLDLRSADGETLAVVMDSASQAAQPLRIDLAAGRIERLPALPPSRFKVEALCLYRDPQRLRHLFLLGEDGQAEQWLLDGPAPRQLRTLSLPPGVEACSVDDAQGQLYLAEMDFGVWAYPADAERKVLRQPVTLRRPWGRLDGGVAALAALPGGVAVLDKAGRELQLWRQDGTSWRLQGRQAYAAARSQLAAGQPAGALWSRVGETRWQPQPLAWRAPARPAELPIVLPRVQTDPVARLGDAADDPAIWVHPTAPQSSRVLATNKKQGLLVYDLDGRERQLLPVGRVNNVDLRQQVRFGARTLDLAVATQRDDLSLVVFGIDADGTVSERARIATGLKDIYGVCLYRPAEGGLEAFVNDKDGVFQHYRIELAGDELKGRLLRRFATRTQPEGCVADDRSGTLFFGEEDRGVWVASARADGGGPAPATPRLILPVGEKITADVEGMALYHGAKRSYLVVSSQGNDSYVVLDAAPPYRYRGAFRVGIDAARGIDAGSETDGLDVTSAPLGAGWEQGMLVVQDGHKRLPDGAQNFKYVPWAEISRALGLEGER